jgi:hypothetical protein
MELKACRWAAFLALALCAIPAHAQTPTTFSPGSTISSAAVNSAFARKQDYPAITQRPGDNSSAVATTAFDDAAIGAAIPSGTTSQVYIGTGAGGSISPASTLPASVQTNITALGTLTVGDLSLGSSTSTGSTTSRTLAARGKDVFNLRDFGAVGDGVTDDTLAVTNCAAAGICYAPVGIYSTTLPDSNITAFEAKIQGPGQILTGNGTTRAPFFTALTARPSASIGSGSGPFGWGAAYGSDISHVQFPVEDHITGAATLGEPTSGYLWTPEASPYLTWMVSNSGWNQDNGDNGGRTGIAAFRTILTQLGLGDMVAYNAEVQCQSNRSGSTSFLAEPGCIIANGDVNAIVSGVYLNPTEYNIEDNGYDVAGIGQVINLYRTNGTGALGATWIGSRLQSLGSSPIDAFYSIMGPSKIGLDTTTASFTANQAAVTLAANQRIYLNATNTGDFSNGTTPGNMWVEYDRSTSDIVIGNGTTRLFSINATTGNVIAMGTITPSGSP